MKNCAQFVGDDKLKCHNHGYKHLNDPKKFNTTDFTRYIKKEYEFTNSPFVYKKGSRNSNSTSNSLASGISAFSSGSGKKFELKPHQKFIGKFVNPHTNSKGVLMYASVGSGKTLTSIVAGLCAVAYYSGQRLPKITVIAPPNLIDNYKQELQTEGPEQVIINGKPQTYRGPRIATAQKTRYFAGNDQNTFINSKLIKKHWTVVTHQAFVNGLYKNQHGGKYIDMLKEPGRLFIIDEVHNLVSENGEQYQKLLTAFTNYLSDTSKVILMSATPIVDSNYEIGLTLNLLRPRVLFPTTKKEFDALSSKQLKWMMYGYVSYFAGGDPSLYPEKTVEMVYHKFDIDSEHYKYYKKVYSKELGNKRTPNGATQKKTGFFVKSLIAVNAFWTPTVKQGLLEQDVSDRYAYFETNVSPKYASVCKQVKKDTGTAVVFTPYINSGVKLLGYILESLGFARYNVLGENRNSKPKYLIWSGDIKDKEQFSKEILPIFNSKENANGSKIKVILATRAISEGITFKNVRNLHICSHFWNENVMKQIIGRCDRINSHKDLPKSKRKLHVYRHVMVLPNFKKKRSSDSELYFSSSRTKSGPDMLKDLSVEEYVISVAAGKSTEHNKMRRIVISASVDCRMNKYGNKHRTYKFIDYDGSIQTRNNATNEISSGTNKVSKCDVKNATPPAVLLRRTLNTEVGRKFMNNIMHSKMTSTDISKINKLKKRLIKCALIALKGPDGKISKTKMPKTYIVSRHIKDFLKTSGIKGDTRAIYKQLVGKKAINTEEDYNLIESLKDYLRVKII
jgi:superfamily II DNA or RNA helicase